MAVMSDFARMPTRQKVMLFAIIGIVLGLVYYQFGYKKLVANLDSAKIEHDGKLATNSKLEKDIPEYAKLKAKMVNLNRIIEENETALPTEAELPAFFDMLNRKVLESGVEVVHITQGKEVPVETFVKVPISYEIQGSFLQIKKFFASLLPKKKHATDAPGEPQETEEKERIVSIENLSLSNPVVRNREIKLTAKFVASTYRQEDTTDAAAKPAAKGGAATPAPAPAGKAAPPTNTPAGAKASTEKSLDKADARSDKANVDDSSTKMKGGVP